MTKPSGARTSERMRRPSSECFGSPRIGKPLVANRPVSVRVSFRFGWRRRIILSSASTTRASPPSAESTSSTDRTDDSGPVETTGGTRSTNLLRLVYSSHGPPVLPHRPTVVAERAQVDHRVHPVAALHVVHEPEAVERREDTMYERSE